MVLKLIPKMTHKVLILKQSTKNTDYNTQNNMLAKWNISKKRLVSSHVIQQLKLNVDFDKIFLNV